MSDGKSKVWLVTGAGKGIGKAIVNAALRHGDSVIATTRTAKRPYF